MTHQTKWLMGCEVIRTLPVSLQPSLSLPPSLFATLSRFLLFQRPPLQNYYSIVLRNSFSSVFLSDGTPICVFIVIDRKLANSLECFVYFFPSANDIMELSKCVPITF